MLFFDNCPSPGGLGEQNRLPGAYSEPLAKVSLPAGGTRKALQASRGCSWPRIVADFVTQPLPDASGVALGSLGVDFGELAAPKMMIFERLFWFFPRALFAARFGFLRYFFHLVFWVVGPRAQTGQMRKLTHFPCENLFFQGTRQRRARHRKGNRRPKTTPTVDATRPLNMSTPCDFPRSRARL